MSSSHSKAIDDTHKRWESGTEYEHLVWNHFNEIVSQQVVREALRRQPLTLISLYQALSRVRSKCEWVKTRNSSATNPENLEYYLTAEMSDNLENLANFDNRFGRFILEGANCEPNLFYVDRGQHVAALLAGRCAVVKKLTSRDKPNCEIGLSIIKIRAELERYGLLFFEIERQSECLIHAEGNIFVAAEADFQALLNTDNIFEFIEIAARLMFDLSNYPPIVRGSAAVNSWIVDHIFKIKFHLNCSIRPLLYDWTAFFETFEQYKTFYVISAVVEYMKSMPVFCKPEYLALYQAIQELMILDPNDLAVLRKRETAWDQLQAIIKLHIASLPNEQQIYLHKIANGMLAFREPSHEIIQFVKNIDGVKELSMQQIKMHIDIKYLKRVVNLTNQIEKRYLRCHGVPAEGVFNQLWADLSYLRTKLDYYKFKELVSCVVSDFNFNPFMRQVNDDHDQYEVPDVSDHSQPEADIAEMMDDRLYSIPEQAAAGSQVERDMAGTELQVRSLKNVGEQCYRTELLGICRASFSSIAKLTDAQKILLLKTGNWKVKAVDYLVNPTEEQKDLYTVRSRDLRSAIISGGVGIEDMLGLSSAILDVLISPAAIMLYNSNLFIRSSELKADSVAKSEMKILRLLAKHYCGYELTEAPSCEVRKLLLSVPELFQTKKLSLSSAVLSSVQSVEFHLLVEYLRFYYQEDYNLKVYRKMSPDLIHHCLSNLKKVLASNDYIAWDMIDRRSILKKYDLSAFALMQLEKDEVWALMADYNKLSPDKYQQLKRKHDELSPRHVRLSSSAEVRQRRPR